MVRKTEQKMILIGEEEAFTPFLPQIKLAIYQLNKFFRRDQNN